MNIEVKLHGHEHNGLLVSWLVGALSSVPHRGLYQDWKQTSVYLLVIHSTSHYTTNLFYWDHNSNEIHNSGLQTQKYNNTSSGAYVYSTGTQHGNLHQLSVTMSRVTYFILRANIGTSVSRSQAQEKLGRGVGRNAGEWTGRVEISKEEVPGSRRSMHGARRTTIEFC